jgi:hypothetical protein
MTRTTHRLNAAGEAAISSLLTAAGIGTDAPLETILVRAITFARPRCEHARGLGACNELWQHYRRGEPVETLGVRYEDGTHRPVGA